MEPLYAPSQTTLPRRICLDITQRCHKKEFLLKFAMDRREWMSRLRS